MEPVVADLSLDGLSLNACLIRTPLNPSDYERIFQTPARVVEPSTPAPYGHRNNQIHLFDHLGLYLIEHHATHLVDALVFVLSLEEAVFAPSEEFSGVLTVGGIRIFPGMPVKDYRGGTIAFDGPLLDLYTASRNGIWIGLRAKGTRLRSGRRSRQLRFVEVSVGFSCAAGHL